jgi:hypothetical protein
MFDLLNPPPAKPKTTPCPKKKLREQYIEIQWHQEDLLSELKATCVSIALMLQVEEIKEVDIASAVHTRIEFLAHIQHLKDLDAQVKTQYKDVFSPIPHVSRLPTDVYCRIKLKDAAKCIATRTYTSLRNTVTHGTP